MGTARCTSITTHVSVVQAHRDDLESHAYILMCFLRGSLPFYTHVLRFNDKPDYSYLRKLFRDIFAREGYQYDYVFGRSRQRATRNGSGRSLCQRQGRPLVARAPPRHPRPRGLPVRLQRATRNAPRIRALPALHLHRHIFMISCIII